jgi:hypothetical protein
MNAEYYQGIVWEFLGHDLEKGDAERPAALLEPRDGRARGPLLFVLFVLVLLRLGVGEGLVVAAVAVVVTAAAAGIRRVLLLLIVIFFLFIVGVVVAGPLPEQLEELGAGLVPAPVDGVILVGARELILLLLALGLPLALAGVRGCRGGGRRS